MDYRTPVFYPESEVVRIKIKYAWTFFLSGAMFILIGMGLISAILSN